MFIYTENDAESDKRIKIIIIMQNTLNIQKYIRKVQNIETMNQTFKFPINIFIISKFHSSYSIHFVYFECLVRAKNHFFRKITSSENPKGGFQWNCQRARRHTRRWCKSSSLMQAARQVARYFPKSRRAWCRTPLLVTKNE